MGTDKLGTVLIIDDNQEFRRVFKKLLGKNHLVIEARDGAEGLFKIGQERPNLVYCDLEMDGLKGLCLLKILSALLDPQYIPPIVIVSGISEASESGFEENARRIGAEKVILKDKIADNYEEIQEEARVYVERDIKRRQELNPELDLELIPKLVEAIEQKSFHLVYQPKYDLNEEKVTGMEALCRWTIDKPEAAESHDFGAAVSKPHTDQQLEVVAYPDKFIPLAEHMKLIHQIDLWVLKEAAQFARTCWQNNWNLKCAINYSGTHFDEFHAQLKTLVEEDSNVTNYLEIELTERNYADAKRVVEECSKLGFDVAMDDFGERAAGFESFYQLSFKCVKIDKKFFDLYLGAGTRERKKMLDKLCEIFKALKVDNGRVVAEGVNENLRNIIGRLKEAGCDQIQGYIYSKPLSEKAFLAFLKEGKRLEF